VLLLSEWEAEVLTLALLDTELEFEAWGVGVVVKEEDEEDESVERLWSSRLTVGLGEGT
jgi:hypothetical protein